MTESSEFVRNQKTNACYFVVNFQKDSETYKIILRQLDSTTKTLLSDSFEWENSAINDNGEITVSSTYPTYQIHLGMYLTKEKITDGKDNSFWHAEGGPSWMNYNLNTPKIITEVIVGVRQGLTLDISKILLEFERLLSRSLQQNVRHTKLSRRIKVG